MVWIMEKVVNKAETKVLHASLSTLRRLTCSRERVHGQGSCAAGGGGDGVCKFVQTPVGRPGDNLTSAQQQQECAQFMCTAATGKPLDQITQVKTRPFVDDKATRSCLAVENKFIFNYNNRRPHRRATSSAASNRINGNMPSEHN